MRADWIHDSLRERNPRSRAAPKPGSLRERLETMDGVLGWMWRALSHALEEGESYVVLTLIGMRRDVRPS